MVSERDDTGELPDPGPDVAVRALLAVHGDDGHIPRHTDFYFYGGNIDSLGKAAARAGYQVRATVNRDGVAIAAAIAVDAQSFDRHAKAMQACAQQFGCALDGWECQVVTQ